MTAPNTRRAIGPASTVVYQQRLNRRAGRAVHPILTLFAEVVAALVAAIALAWWVG